jgi:uncharacterized protein (TIGR00369 family)
LHWHSSYLRKVVKPFQKIKKVQQFIPQNPNFKELIPQKMEANHFMNHLGFKANKIEAGLVEGILEIEQHHRQQIGFLHGGVIATLADLVMGFGCFSLVKEGQAVVTAEMKISYLNPGLGPVAFCKGYVIKAGQKLHFAEAEIYTENKGVQTLIARGYGTYAVI